MNEYQLISGLTRLADNELADENLRDEIILEMSKDPALEKKYKVQVIISKNLKEFIVKYPVPPALHKKLKKILSQ